MSKNPTANRFSLLACIFISIFLISYRGITIDTDSKASFVATNWDAFGYYVYLPAFLIYEDATKLEWLPAIDQKYGVTGGKLYQANKYKNGNYVFKYLGGVSLMELPWFLLGHSIAKWLDFPADGFFSSLPILFGFRGGILLCFEFVSTTNFIASLF